MIRRILGRILASPALCTAIVLAAFSLLAPWLGVPQTQVTQIAIYALYGAAVNLLIAYTGLVPFGASVFFGFGSYATALSMLYIGGNEFVGIATAVIGSLLLAALLGAVILRRQGLYFSLLTLAASQIAYEIAFRWTSLTGGENGRQNLPRPFFADATTFNAVACTIVVLVVWGFWRFAHAPVGRSLQAIRDNAQRMASLGYDIYRLRLVAFIVAGTGVGLAGGLLAVLLQGAYPNNLNWQHAGDALLMVVLGGVHHVLGALWGAGAFILLEDWLGAHMENWWLAFAPIIIVFALLAPEGLHGLFRRVTRRSGWSLVKPGIPPRPAFIAPFADSGERLDPATPILSIRGLSKHFGSLHVARGIDLDIMPYRLHSLIGPNGAGKTTFFNMLTGMTRQDGGTLRFLGTDITNLKVHLRSRLGLGRSFQIVSVFANLPAFENVRIAVQSTREDRHGLWRDAHLSAETNDRTWSLLAAVGLADRAAVMCRDLSHGERRLLDIAVTLANNAKLLLLDEPLAGLGEADRIVVSRLIRTLADTHAVLLVEHDIDRVVEFSDRISVLHQGRLIADGSPRDVVAQPEVIAAYLGASADIRPHVAAMAPQQLAAPALLRVEGIVAGYDGSRILDGIDLTLRPGEAMALLGRNGAGKTTLLRAITGTLKANAGLIDFNGVAITGMQPFAINRHGIALVPEGRRLFGNLTVRDNLRLAQRPGGISLEEAYALFPRLRERQGVRAENLSGGERQMGAIARALMAPARLLLLDEPFEGLAPAVVSELSDAVLKLRDRMAIILVEHHAEKVLPLVDSAIVLVNGRVAYSGSSLELAADADLQHRLLGVVEPEKQLA